ncbi:MAG TPA: hypothetical protein VMD48_03030 [Solirubrobacteraceae bacterium]|nr:hypothetical protein [Solirubrobacteraceae bacterium]
MRPVEREAAGFRAVVVAGFRAVVREAVGFLAAVLDAAGFRAVVREAAGFRAAVLDAAGFRAVVRDAAGFRAGERRAVVFACTSSFASVSATFSLLRSFIRPLFDFCASRRSVFRVLATSL